MGHNPSGPGFIICQGLRLPPQRNDHCRERKSATAPRSHHRQTPSGQLCHPSQGFRPIAFDALYTFTGDERQPFQEKTSIPAQFDVEAYVWGSERCAPSAFCKRGDYYWLIGRGPGNEFNTWVVTPQYPRMIIQSPCYEWLRIGQRYRFSFSRGKLVGFSRD
ncbi:hypothetical protein P3339_02855 [Microbulbifer sp. MLAF003]|uniref:hypothetical protein n=1 Tax=Microbulbifer sp. MLAF003 TaxID=3032582 RepID=UPI0024AD8A4D|nr:hypothetical protein [Microbulbifer sp. MLAF003]WHI51788.1 hypothetical protein P3339_02855 [Microbulbifer sp. MLAF003]